MRTRPTLIAALLAAWPLTAAADSRPPARDRFADPEAKEVPDFQRHMLPLMGRLGCNTRSCHGSFQGRGGFRLSLFGYDFKMDHEALLKDDSGRVDRETPELSKVIQKSTLGIPHKGGKRMDPDSWQYRMFLNWIDAGAKGVTEASQFERLEVTPRQVVFSKAGEKVALKVVAHWADGSSEDVTCIARFRTNDESIAEIDEDGVVTSLGPGDTHIVAFYDNGVSPVQVFLPVSDKVGPSYPDVPTPTKVDELIVAKLKTLGIVPSPLADDAEFLRRVSLDMTGTLPTPKEVEAFLSDSSADKRSKKIDELLARPSYAAWWTTQLCDITGASPRNLQGQTANDQLARHWYEWINRRVADNMPYDQLVAGIVLGKSRRPEQSYDDFNKEQSSYYRSDDPADFTKRETMPYFWARRNLRQPEEKALAFSYTFLGVRLECAQCHKHPFDQWTQDDFNGFKAFFNTVAYGIPPDARKRAEEMREELGLKGKNNGQVQRELAGMLKDGKVIPWQEVYVAPARRANRPKGDKAKAQGKGGRVITPKILGGEEVALEGTDDPRRHLMDWMRQSDNPYFTRVFVNRVWSVYFGRGIVNPPDDMNLANPPSNEALLDHLAEGFLAHGFDMKWLHREIANSQAYQRSWQANETNRLDEKNFSRAVVRRLPAEVMLDAVAQATAGSVELDRLATSVEDRLIGPRGGAGLNLARRGNGDYALRVFGRSTRETNCDCSRSNEPNLLQSIFLQNDNDLHNALERKEGWVAEHNAVIDRAQRAKSAASKVDSLTKEIARAERRLEEIEDGDKDKRAVKLEERLAELRKQLESARRDETQAEQVSAAPSNDPETLVREAYLRTLGRRPDEAEMAFAREHLASAGSTPKGLRDLLWALVNTKEFVTNH